MFELDPNAVDITTADYVPPRHSFGKRDWTLLLLQTDYDMMTAGGRIWGGLVGRQTNMLPE